MTRNLVTFVAMVAFAATPAKAASIVPTAGALTAQLFLGPGDTVLGFDIRGALVADVLDPGSLGAVLLTDGGSPPLSGLLLAANAGFTEAVLLALDGLAPVLGAGPGVLIPAAPVSFDPIGDAALSRFLSPLVFGFSVAAVTPDLGSGGVVVDLVLESIASPVPEPAAVVTTFAGLLLLTLRLRRTA
jgi:hypothetical protein